MRRVKRPTGRTKGRSDRKDLYTAILSVLQSHFDSDLSRPASPAEFNDGAAVNISGSGNRAMLAHQIGQDAVNDWLSAKLTSEVWNSFGMTHA